jgi:hypothetical protein
MLETICHQGEVLAYLIRGKTLPTQTTFYTPDDSPLQVGHISYPAGGEVARHFHRPVDRQLTVTGEVFLVQKGACSVDVYVDGPIRVATLELSTGDTVIFVGGGHGMRMHQDTVLLEIKQGPYGGPEEKELF